MLFTPDGKPFLAYGSPGGATIINSVVNITINLIDHKMTLQQAIDAARISVPAPARASRWRTAFRRPRPTPCGRSGTPSASATSVSVQAVLIDQQTGKQYGGADDRREGKVIGLPQSF